MSATISLPSRTLDQRMNALRYANRIRCQRAELKRRVASGETDALSVLSRCPRYVETMKVRDLLLAVPGLGPIKADLILGAHDISAWKSIGSLTERQAGVLVDALRNWKRNLAFYRERRAA